MSLKRNALLLILLTGLLAILGEWSPALARAWCVPAALLLVGLAYEGVIVGRYAVHLRLLAPERWPLARAIEMRCVLEQRSRPYVPIELLLCAPDEFTAEPRAQTLRLARAVPRVAVLVAAPRRLGSYRWPSPALRIGGPLGLAWWSRRMHGTRSVIVVPDLIDRFEQAAGAHHAGGERARRAGVGAEILQLRDYRPSDPLRTIDWKASARRGRLISRDMSEDQHLEVIVAIDAGRASALGAGEIDRLGLSVNIAARLAQRAVALDDAVGLLIFASQPLAALAPARGDAAVMRIRELLSACRAQPTESNPVLAAVRIRALAHRRSLVVILTDLEDASAGEQLVEAVKLLAPKHFTFIAGFESARIEGLARAAVGEPLGAYRALAAVEYQNALAANVRALRTLGAAALTARPEHLDHAVFEAYAQIRGRRRV
ncbi:MAG: DUF58 domain-containing protein [Steroidobacteraceae bacterium]